MKNVQSPVRANESACISDSFLLTFFRSPLEHCSHRRAYRLVRAMSAAYPAARSAHSFLEFFDCPLDMFLSRLVFLHRNNPAYPLVARKRGNILPRCERLCIGKKAFSQIFGHTMYDAMRNFFFGWRLAHTHSTHPEIIRVRSLGIEPRQSAWKAEIIPLDHDRTIV